MSAPALRVPSEGDPIQAVVESLRERIGQHGASPEQVALLMGVLDGLEKHRAGSEPPPPLPAVQVPLLIGWGLTGRADATRALAEVTLAVYLGIDLLDDLMDGDTPKYWTDAPPPHVALAASTLLFALAPVLVSGLPVEAAVARRLQQRLGSCLLHMGAGQLADVDAFGELPEPEQVKATVDAKSGEMLAAFAELAALAVGSPEEVVLRAGRYGRSLAVARQIASDLAEALDPGTSCDRRNAAPTLPIAYHAALLDPEARRCFRDQLRASRTNTLASHALLHTLRAGRGIAMALLDAEFACVDALEVLTELELQEQADSGLRALVEATSILRCEANC